MCHSNIYFNKKITKKKASIIQALYLKLSLTLLLVCGFTVPPCMAQSEATSMFSEKSFSLLPPDIQLDKNKPGMWRVSIQGKEPLNIGQADHVEALGFVQLDGLPFSLNILKSPTSIKPLNLNNKKSTINISLLLKSGSLKKHMNYNQKIDTLILVNVKNNRIVWQEKINQYSSSGGGYKTIALDFISPYKLESKAQAQINLQLLFIEAIQTSLPSTQSQPYMPGPPLKLLFAVQKDVYKRVY